MRRILFATALMLPLVASAEAPSVPRVKSVLVISPSYMRCDHCDRFHADRVRLERRYPGLRVFEVQVSDRAARQLGITAFPTMIVGELLTGYDSEELERLLR